jgi:hypothetical protein
VAASFQGFISLTKIPENRQRLKVKDQTPILPHRTVL